MRYLNAQLVGGESIRARGALSSHRLFVTETVGRRDPPPLAALINNVQFQS